MRLRRFRRGPAPPRLEAELDTTGLGRVHLDQTPSKVSDTRLTESLLTATIFTDESANPDSTCFYAVTAVNESPRFGKVGGLLRATEAAASAEVYAKETVGFGKTGVDLRFTSLVGTGQVAVTKRTDPLAQPEGINQPNVSSCRLVTEAEEGLSLTSGMEVHLDTSRLAGLENPTKVNACGREGRRIGWISR